MVVILLLVGRRIEETCSEVLSHNVLEKCQSTGVKFQELQLLDFEKLATATNKFHTANKLGKGGFGVVYKFQDGQEIAVKSLSRASGQGIEEFINEAVVISQLQHRNLARKLWSDGVILALIDPAISDPSFHKEISRCLHVGLLCVQYSAKDRPTVSTGTLMLSTYPSDPSDGNFSAGIDPLNIPEAFIWNNNRPYWRSGPWNGQVFIGVPQMYSVYLDGFSLIDDKQGSIYITFAFANLSLSYILLDSQGNLALRVWDDKQGDWVTFWSLPETECDVYGQCGAFGSCDSLKPSICSCLRGFEPKIIEEWNRGNWTSGCVRSKPLQCERVNNSSELGKDGFLKLGMMKVPDFAQWSRAGSEYECKEFCLRNCSCIAYAYDAGIGLAHRSLTTGFISARKEKGGEQLWFSRGKAHPNFVSDNVHGDNINQANLQELPLFNFEELATATNNFHPTNKLGQGGFGPVYRGKLQNGKEIAVKRLSSASGQGLEELMNEVVVISKLQHRNLVRLLGCCVEEDEKMLVYEYMTNKSLDAFLFDPVQQEILDWRKRFNIIEGISRGLLYLHRDSRLRIIHRDLKASNILLDEELNPKISDFGMARIFGGNENQANTTKVVGTYGYMPPEYAMAGRFSEKSDVFSYGALLLEIVSGRKNTSFYGNEDSISLLGYVWKLWNEDNILALLHTGLYDPCYQREIVKCIHAGLLCVQEFAEDRPTISTVISMLNSEIVDLPAPKQPAYTGRLIASGARSPQNNLNHCSINKVTLTTVEGR
ncbi:S-locus glycoprotein domain - like 9 [Theobroma cacao]|nr:S-locus glycoprotein domain - like 9 [Theobroma cacao]